MREQINAFGDAAAAAAFVAASLFPSCHSVSLSPSSVSLPWISCPEFLRPFECEGETVRDREERERETEKETEQTAALHSLSFPLLLLPFDSAGKSISLL